MRQWGGRFDAEPDKLLQDFQQSIDFDWRLVQEDIQGSIAHCRMLARQGILTAAEATAIEKGLEQIAGEAARNEIPMDHALEDVHTHVEARLRQLIGPAAGKLHTARSRNDQVALDVRLYVRGALLQTISAIAGLQDVLQQRAQDWFDVIAPGYTHLQRAQPVLLAHHLLAYHEMLARDAERFRDAYPRINQMPLGAGALAGLPYPIDREFVARELGFASITRNSLDAVGDRDFVVEYVSAAALLMAHLSRLAEEIVLWSTSEFGYLQLADAFTTGSSIMPQKKNPDAAELIRGKVGRVYGNLNRLLVTIKGLPLAYNKDLQEDKEALFDTVDTILPSLTITAAMLGSAKVNSDRLATAAAAGFSLATDVADYLVARGVPFREAHALVGLAVHRCLELGRDLATLPLAEYQAISPLFDERVYAIDVRSSVAARDVPGGTAPNRVRAALNAARASTGELRAWVEARRTELART
jgi:argininosuccinate lyase